MLLFVENLDFFLSSLWRIMIKKRKKLGEQAWSESQVSPEPLQSRGVWRNGFLARIYWWTSILGFSYLNGTDDDDDGSGGWWFIVIFWKMLI